MTLSVPEGPPLSKSGCTGTVCMDGAPTLVDTPKQARVDARTNRERVLAAARDAFTVSGGTSLTAIAKQAGVGIGTLYRHFPNRESLIVALYRHDIQELIDLAPALLAAHPPLTALRLWFDEVARYGQLKYGVAEVIHAATNGGLDDEHYRPFVEAIALLLERGIAAGALKPDLDPEDVLLQLSVLWRIKPGNGGAERATRILDLIVDGLQVNPQSG